MKTLITKIDSRISNLNEYSSDSDTSSESSSDSSSSEYRFSNDHELTRKRTMSNKGLMINIPNYLSKLSPTTSINSNDLSTRKVPEEKNIGRGRGLSFSQRLKNNNMLINSNMNKDFNTSNSSVDIPIEFKEIIRSRSNSRTRANSMNNNLDQIMIGDKSRTTSFGEPITNNTKSNTNLMKTRNSRNTSMTNLKKMTSSLDSINSINSLKKSSSSLLMTGSPSSGPISMKNLKKYLTTGDEMFLTDELSDEDLFMNNLSHQQLKKRNGDVMVNMTSSANLYSLDNGSVMKDDIEIIKKNTKVINNNIIENDYTMPFDTLTKTNKADSMSETESMDLNTGLTFSNSFSKQLKNNDKSHPESVTSNTTIKANNLKAYKKITPIDLYGDNNDDLNDHVSNGSEWFLGGNV